MSPQHNHYANAEPNHYLDFLAVGAPYLASLVLLLFSNPHSRSLASGIAGAAAAVLLYWEGLLFAALLIALVFEQSPSMRGPGPGSGPLAAFVVLSIVCNLVVFFSSLGPLRRGVLSITLFALGAAVSVAYAQGVHFFQEKSQAKYFKGLDDIDKESEAAFQVVESISWCAIEYANAHPDEGYPASINAISGNPLCKRLWSLGAIPHYTVSYTSSRNDSGRVTAFSVKAVTPPNPLRPPKNAESDQSGIALIEYQDSRDNRYPVQIGTGSPLSIIWQNEICFRDYATDHSAVAFPRSFADVPNCYNAFRQYGSTFLSDTAVRWGYYLFVYSPSVPDRSGMRRSYRLNVTCEVCGTSCLHSFLLTSDGRVFVTSADRSATLEDTLLSPCPKSRGAATTFCSQDESTIAPTWR